MNERQCETTIPEQKLGEFLAEMLENLGNSGTRSDDTASIAEDCKFRALGRALIARTEILE